jgi:hypothetical protein
MGGVAISNGFFPQNLLVQFDTGGGKHVGTVGTRDKWYRLRENVQRKYGKTLQITDGWNVYRPWSEQVAGRNHACAQGNCNAAASPGWSSHGGTWGSAKYTGGNRVPSLALDIGNYWIIGQQAFYDEARAVGFLAGAITPEIAGIFEPWHIIDLDPLRIPEQKEWDEMVSKDELRQVVREVVRGEVAKVAGEVWNYKMTGGAKDDPNSVPAETAGTRLRNIRRSTDLLKGRTLRIESGVARIETAIAAPDEPDAPAATK